MVRIIAGAAVFWGAFIIGVLYNAKRESETKQLTQGSYAQASLEEAGEPRTDAAQRKDCYGTLTYMPVVGIHIGQCDLNSISTKNSSRLQMSVANLEA
jgi:hypothetical protein